MKQNLTFEVETPDQAALLVAVADILSGNPVHDDVVSRLLNVIANFTLSKNFAGELHFIEYSQLSSESWGRTIERLNRMITKIELSISKERENREKAPG